MPDVAELAHRLEVLAAFDTSDTPTGDLRQFVESFFHLDFGNGYLIQVYAITAIIGILIVMGLAVTARRLYEGNFWLVRIQEAEGSKYPLVIPNSILTFVFIEAIFGIVYVVYLWCQLGGMKWGKDLGGQGYWILTPWLVLYFGAFYGAVGTFYASPGTLSRRRRVSSRWDVAKLIPSPIVCNQVLIGVPVINTFSILIITVILGRAWHGAFEHMQHAARMLDEVPPTSPIMEAHRQLALEVWQHTIDAWWYASVGFYMWGAWAFLLLALYLPSGGHLSHTVHVQVNEQKAFRDVKFHHSHVTPTARGDAPATVPSGAAPVWDAASKLETAETTPQSRRNREAEMEATRAAESTFYPPLKATRVSVHMSEASANLRNLKSALRNIILMWTSISCAVFAYGVLCIWAAAKIRTVVSESPESIASFYVTYNSAAGWLACSFGGLNFVWITSRTFEPVLDGLQLKHAAGGKSHRSTLTTFFTSSRPNFGRPVLRPSNRPKRGAPGATTTTDPNDNSEAEHHTKGPSDRQGTVRNIELSMVEEVTSFGVHTDDELTNILRNKSDRSPEHTTRQGEGDEDLDTNSDHYEYRDNSRAERRAPSVASLDVKVPEPVQCAEGATSNGGTGVQRQHSMRGRTSLSTLVPALSHGSGKVHSPVDSELSPSATSPSSGHGKSASFR